MIPRGVYPADLSYSVCNVNTDEDCIRYALFFLKGSVRDTLILMWRSSSEKRLKELRKKWREQEARTSETIRCRLRLFRRGKLSSEEFEKEIEGERSVTRLERIMRLGRSKPKAEVWKVRVHRSLGIDSDEN